MGHRRAQRVDFDLDEIWFYIATESGSVETADRFVKSLTDHFYLLSQNPYLGRTRDADLRLGVRSFPVGRYIITVQNRRRGCCNSSRPAWQSQCQSAY